MNRLASFLLFFFSALAASELISDRLSNIYYVLFLESFKYYGELAFLFLGIVIGFTYLIKFGSKLFSEELNNQSQPSSDNLLNLIPFKEVIRKVITNIWSLIKPSIVGNYLIQIYAKPVASEHILGGFFFSKTLLITAIAFYHLPTHTLILVIIFSTFFDSLTGLFQQTLMNFFHRSIFKNRFLAFTQNLLKRYFIDIFRAQIITLFIMGLNTFSYNEQFHIFQNRFVSASYYFNAVLIDKLVDMKVISRNFRSRFIIFASSIGGMLCLLDFAKTDFPSWVTPQMINAIPSWIPGPLKLLAYFNISVFLITGFIYLMYSPIVTFHIKRQAIRLAMPLVKLIYSR